MRIKLVMGVLFFFLTQSSFCAGTLIGVTMVDGDLPYRVHFSDGTTVQVADPFEATLASAVLRSSGVGTVTRAQLGLLALAAEINKRNLPSNMAIVGLRSYDYLDGSPSLTSGDTTYDYSSAKSTFGMTIVPLGEGNSPAIAFIPADRRAEVLNLKLPGNQSLVSDLEAAQGAALITVYFRDGYDPEISWFQDQREGASPAATQEFPLPNVTPAQDNNFNWYANVTAAQQTTLAGYVFSAAQGGPWQGAPMLLAEGSLPVTS